MYRVYHTEGLVLGGSPAGEAGKMLALFTRDFGLVHAHAQGIRLEKSKLRYVLQPYSLARINLVRGKAGFRVVSASCEDALEVLGGDERNRSALRAIVSISEFLERLLHGEERNDGLFADVRAGIDAIVHGDRASAEIRALKLAVMIKALKHLGYWKPNAELEPFVRLDVKDAAALERLLPLANAAACEIERALEASQL